jgi:hypothetical protein
MPRTDHQHAEANRRLALLTRLAEMERAQGDAFSLRRAAAPLGVSFSSLSRWRAAYLEYGFDGLLADDPVPGSRSLLAKIDPGQEHLDAIKAKSLDTRSVTTAARHYAHDPACPPALSEAILAPRKSKQSLPRSLRDAITPSQPLRDLHHGPRRLSLNSLSVPRKVDILPGDIFCPDDTTPIWGYWVGVPESEQYPFGKMLLQGQLLIAIDVASQKAISFALIARDTAGYRACDIWSWFGAVHDSPGLPRLGWQMERGTWESHLIAGVECEYQAGETTLSRRLGGLRMLPSNPCPEARPEALRDMFTCFPKTLQTWTSFLPKTKSIEAFFNRSQQLEGMLYGCLGRDQQRAPMERAKKIYNACRRNAEDPGHHFLEQTEILNRLRSLIDWLNHEPIEGTVFHGVPEILWQNAVRDLPLYRPPEESRYLFLRHWAKTRVHKGMIRLHPAAHAPLEYFSPDLAHHEGQHVLCYYDAFNLELDAEILSCRTGERLCSAPFFARVGQFNDTSRHGLDAQKQYREIVRSAYADLTPLIPSRQLPPEIKARREVNGECPSRAQQREQSTSAAPPETSRTNTLPTRPESAPISYRTRQLMEDAEASV